MISPFGNAMATTPPIAVVTGSSSGIGQSTAIRLAKSGYDVIVHARSNVDGLDETSQAVRASGRECRALQADICNSDSIHQLISSAFQWKGRVDTWVNNAGADVLTDEAAKWDFDRKLKLLLDTDVVGTITVSRMVAARMLKQPDAASSPTIINIGWDQAFLGMADEPGQMFCTTKAAVMAFTKALAMTVGPKVRVNCVAPGWIKTAWGNQADSYWDQRAKSESLLDRWGTAEDVAACIEWLASPSAAFINGQCIEVNGGRKYV
jgi:3-oxoacyl-[acyl-carrier protein] reductase